VGSSEAFLERFWVVGSWGPKRRMLP
jgi:hypothetical protein